MKKVIFASLLLTAPLCKAADYRGIDLVNEDAWNVIREVAQTISYHWAIYKARISHRLNLDGYGIKNPDDLNHLRHLFRLSLNNNQLTDIPDSQNIAWMLQELHLNDNQIATIPNGLNSDPHHEITFRDYGPAKNVRTVATTYRFFFLRRLYLNNNQIQAIPNDFQLRRLEILSLNNNRIQAIDLHVLDQLPNLQELHVDQNYLTEDNIGELKEYAEGQENLTIFFGEQKKGLNSKGTRR